MNIYTARSTQKIKSSAYETCVVVDDMTVGARGAPVVAPDTTHAHDSL